MTNVPIKSVAWDQCHSIAFFIVVLLIYITVVWLDLFFVPVYIVKISTVPKKLLRIGPDPFFHSPAQATVHSPKLIFHVMKFRDQKSVLLSVNLLIGRTGITWNLTPVKRPFLSYLSIRILILQHWPWI